MEWRSLALSALMLVSAACGEVDPSPSTPPSAPARHLELDQDVLITATYSGFYRDNDERTLPMYPHVVVFRDGVVVANTSPFGQDLGQHHEFVRLNQAQLADVREIVEAANIRDRLPTIEDYPYAGGSIVIFAVPDGSGRAIEMAMRPTYSDVPEVDASGHPPEIVALDGLLNQLRELVIRDGRRFSGHLPGVPIAPGMAL